METAEECYDRLRGEGKSHIGAMKDIVQLEIFSSQIINVADEEWKKIELAKLAEFDRRMLGVVDFPKGSTNE